MKIKTSLNTVDIANLIKKVIENERIYNSNIIKEEDVIFTANDCKTGVRMQVTNVMAEYEGTRQ